MFRKIIILFLFPLLALATSGSIDLGSNISNTGSSGGGGGGGGSGTVLQVNTGAGLTGGPITTTGTIVLVAPAGGSVLGGVQSSLASNNLFFNGVNTAGLFSSAQPTFANLAGVASGAQLPPAGASLGGVQSSLASGNFFVTGITNAGVLTSAIPNIQNLSGVTQISQGGTSAITASTARAALSVQFSGNIITSGTTYTTPPTITTGTQFKFDLIGGGGGSGGNTTTNGRNAGGGAGGGCRIYTSGLSPNTAYTIAIGAAGSAGNTTPSNGGNGGNTTMTINGTTYIAGGGQGAVSSSSSGLATPGGVTTNCNSSLAIGIVGQYGTGVANSATSAQSGNGGSSPWGWGFGGAYSGSTGAIGIGGMSGTGYGAGAAGSACGSTCASGVPGAAGDLGVISVEYTN